jgi:hypothetical protein
MKEVELVIKAFDNGIIELLRDTGDGLERIEPSELSDSEVSALFEVVDEYEESKR